MMLIKSLVATSFLALTTSAFAGTVVKTQTLHLDDSGIAALRVWSSVCVGNLDVEKTIDIQYRWGAEGEWSAEKLEKNSQIIFSQRYTNDIAPNKLSVKFLNKDGVEAQELSYDLNQTETRLRPRKCDNVENYNFQKTDAPELTIDLVHVGG